jgi:hypothetical protein
MSDRHHTTPEGNIPFTDAENLARDAEEKAWADGATARKMVEIRIERNEKLASTDWWGASDNTMTDAQKKYRADLRDYPATYTADNSADWPTEP